MTAVLFACGASGSAAVPPARGSSGALSGRAKAASEQQYIAVRIDPRTREETTLGRIAVLARAPHTARVVRGTSALRRTVARMNRLESVVSAGIGDRPGTPVARSENQFFRIMRGMWLERKQGILLQVAVDRGPRPARYRVFDMKKDANVELGTVEVKSNQYLRIVTSSADTRERLYAVIEEANERDGRSVDIPPPPGERGSWGRPVERGTALFFRLMRDELHRFHDIVLVPADHDRSEAVVRHERTRPSSGSVWLSVDAPVDLEQEVSGSDVLKLVATDGGPTELLVRRYSDQPASSVTLTNWVEATYGQHSGFLLGDVRSITIAGRTVAAVPFRTRHATGRVDSTAILWPRTWFSGRGEVNDDAGLFLLFRAPAAKSKSPRIATALSAPQLQTAVDSLYVNIGW